MKWQCADKTFTFDRPIVMGIVNVTPDSFSGDGLGHDLNRIIERAMLLLEEGADIIDVGGESTRPGAEDVLLEEEKRRVLPVIEALASKGVIVSVDTMKAEIMRAAIESGAKIINDVSGFGNNDALSTVIDSDCGVIIMHMQGRPRDMQNHPTYNDVVSDVGIFLRQRVDMLEAAGIDRMRICVDPGIGFGKTKEHNLELLRNLPKLSDDLPILVGVSRKSLFSEITQGCPPHQRDMVSAVTAALLSLCGGKIFRVHNVAMTMDALKTASFLLAGGRNA